MGATVAWWRADRRGQRRADLAIAKGGPGTGNGVIGGAAALVLGLIAMVLGGLTRPDLAAPFEEASINRRENWYPGGQPFS